MGTVYWITGLSGAGKTTIGRLLYERIKEKNPNTVFLDGDILRKVFGDDLGYTKEDRRKCAMRYSRLCAMLQEQGMNVVCCTISMFDSVREWNRQNILDYVEIYIEVPMDILKRRNQKNLYQDVQQGMTENVAGVDLAAELPKAPDIILSNDGGNNPDHVCRKLIKRIEECQLKNMELAGNQYDK